MKKQIFLIVSVTMLVCSSCSRKSGCPTSGAAVGAERILGGDKKAIKASKNSKYKGGRKSY